MTDRHAGYVVTLADDIREDDAEATINAIRQIKGVIGVQPVVSDPAMLLAEMRANVKWRERIYTMLRGAE